MPWQTWVFVSVLSPNASLQGDSAFVYISRHKELTGLNTPNTQKWPCWAVKDFAQAVNSKTQYICRCPSFLYCFLFLNWARICPHSPLVLASILLFWGLYLFGSLPNIISEWPSLGFVNHHLRAFTVSYALLCSERHTTTTIANGTIRLCPWAVSMFNAESVSSSS